MVAMRPANVAQDLEVELPPSPSKPHQAEPQAPAGNKRVSSGLPPWVRYHDYFNLAALGALSLLNLYTMATHGKGFITFWNVTMLYFLLDLIFIGAVPSCVKSPNVLLTHHIISSLYTLIPLHYPEYQWCMCACMLVEINTWFLIARRTWPGVPALSAAFYISWVLLRNLLYPWLIYAFFWEWRAETDKCGSPWNPILITPVFQVALTFLNCQWTYALAVSLQSKSKASKQL